MKAAERLRDASKPAIWCRADAEDRSRALVPTMGGSHTELPISMHNHMLNTTSLLILTNTLGTESTPCAISQGALALLGQPPAAEAAYKVSDMH